MCGAGKSGLENRSYPSAGPDDSAKFFEHYLRSLIPLGQALRHHLCGGDLLGLPLTFTSQFLILYLLYLKSIFMSLPSVAGCSKSCEEFHGPMEENCWTVRVQGDAKRKFKLENENCKMIGISRSIQCYSLLPKVCSLLQPWALDRNAVQFTVNDPCLLLEEIMGKNSGRSPTFGI